MPRYDYRCQNCGYAFEVRVTISQKAEGIEPECPECHSNAARQIFHPTPFSGFAFHGDPATIVNPKVDRQS